jgi:hypothetical protein
MPFQPNRRFNVIRKIARIKGCSATALPKIYSEVSLGSVIKKRRKRMSKKKHRKLLRKTRHQRRNKK